MLCANFEGTLKREGSVVINKEVNCVPGREKTMQRYKRMKKNIEF